MQPEPVLSPKEKRAVGAGILLPPVKEIGRGRVSSLGSKLQGDGGSVAQRSSGAIVGTSKHLGVAIFLWPAFRVQA